MPGTGIAAIGIGKSQSCEQARAPGNSIAGPVVVFGRKRIRNQRGPVLHVIHRLGSIKRFPHGGRHENSFEKLLSDALKLHVGAIQVEIVIKIGSLALHAGGSPDADKSLCAEEAGARELALGQFDGNRGHIKTAKTVDTAGLIATHRPTAQSAEREARKVAEQILLAGENAVELANVGDKWIVTQTGEYLHMALLERLPSAALYGGPVF